MPDFTPDELEQLITYHLEHELDRGTVIRNLGAWRESTRKQCLENERLMPGYVTRSVLAITAKHEGRKLTYCREVRGSHQLTHVFDPRGTDPTPPWWNRDEAKREWDATHPATPTRRLKAV